MMRAALALGVLGAVLGCGGDKPVEHHAPPVKPPPAQITSTPPSPLAPNQSPAPALHVTLADCELVSAARVVGSLPAGAGMHKVSVIPELDIGPPTVEGLYDKTIIRRIIRHFATKLTFCYETQLHAKPKLAGTVTANFTIDGDGRVSSSTATGLDSAVAACVADVIRGIEFPKPPGGAKIIVKYPYTFHTPEGWDPDQPPAPPIVRVSNPLAPNVSALDACLVKRNAAAGTATFDLVIDGGGAVTSATFAGVDDETAACFTSVAHGVKLQAPARTLSCAFSVDP
jgi:hypothetical protein